MVMTANMQETMAWLTVRGFFARALVPIEPIDSWNEEPTVEIPVQSMHELVYGE